MYVAERRKANRRLPGLAGVNEDSGSGQGKNGVKGMN